MKIQLFNQYKSILLLGIGCLLLLTLIFWQWQAFRQDDVNFSKQLHHPITTKNLFDNLPEAHNGLTVKEDYEAIINAPLFIEGRKPIASIASSAQGDNGSALSFKLTGVILTPKYLLALLIDDKNLSHRVKEGDDIQGWKVVFVQKDKISLSKSDQSKELLLVDKKPNTTMISNPMMQNYPEVMPNDFPMEIPNNPGANPYAQ